MGLAASDSTREFDTVKETVELKVRRCAVKQKKRKGFGWTRWSSDVVYGSWGLFNDYKIRHPKRKQRYPEQTHNPERMTPSR